MDTISPEAIATLQTTFRKELILLNQKWNSTSDWKKSPYSRYVLELNKTITCILDLISSSREDLPLLKRLALQLFDESLTLILYQDQSQNHALGENFAQSFISAELLSLSHLKQALPELLGSLSIYAAMTDFLQLTGSLGAFCGAIFDVQTFVTKSDYAIPS